MDAKSFEAEFELVSALRRVLTPDLGTLEYFEGRNLLVVKDIKPVIEEIESIINQIDTEPAQILIEVRFVLTEDSDIADCDIGGWTPGFGAIPTWPPFTLGHGGRLPFNLGHGGWLPFNLGHGGFEDQVSFPTNSSDSIPWGALSYQEVTVALRLLNQDVRSEIFRMPKRIALDHQEATILAGETLRYVQTRMEQGQSGGLQLTVEEANPPVSFGLKLLVVPHIVPGTDKIIMDVIPQSEALMDSSCGGSVFCLSLQAPDPGAVWYCDLQAVFADSEAEPELYPVASSFELFLSRLQLFP